jgi:hypothetical protein
MFKNYLFLSEIYNGKLIQAIAQVKLIQIKLVVRQINFDTQIFSLSPYFPNSQPNLNLSKLVWLTTRAYLPIRFC